MVLDEDTSKVETIFKIWLKTTIYLETSSLDLGSELCILHMCMFQWQRTCPGAEEKSSLECDSVQREGILPKAITFFQLLRDKRSLSH